MGFGTVTDVEDIVQTLTLRHHTKWTKSIDKSDNAQSAYMFKAGQFMALQNKEQDMPLRDKYTLREWALHAGITKTASAALSKSNIVENLLDLEAELDNNAVPMDNRWVYTKISYRKYIRMAAEWVGADTITRDMIIKGYEGNIGTLKLVFVPDSWMPTNVDILVAQESCVLQPIVHVTARVLEVAQGFDGPVMEYHSLDDAFVKGVKDKGVIALIKYGQSAQAADITVGNVTGSGASTYVTLTSAGTTVYYTLDGTDPRWSDTAVAISSGGNAVIGASYTGTLRAVARNTTAGSEKYTSNEKTQHFTNSAKD